MQQQNTQKVEASKVPEYIKKAAKKAAEFNSNLNRERMEERRAYFDLQTHVGDWASSYLVLQLHVGDWAPTGTADVCGWLSSTAPGPTSWLCFIAVATIPFIIRCICCQFSVLLSAQKLSE